MESFCIEGGNPLRGEVTPSGNKNAALPLLCATILTDEPVILHNIPMIRDVLAMRRLIESLGVTFEEVDPHTWKIQAKNVEASRLDPDLCRRVRASILLAGPMCARCGELLLPPPGGDVIGRRRVDTHILALVKLGADAFYDRQYHFSVKGRLHGCNILMDEASVTATENAIMAAVTAEGTTVLRNAASEPHIQELCHLLNAMGAKISNIGANVLTIEGVESLHGAEFTIGPDYLEVVSYIGAAAMTHGEVMIRNAGNEYLDMVSLVFNRMGVRWEVIGDDILVPENQRLTVEPDLGGAIPEISVLPWPGFPSDLMSIAIVMATQVTGSMRRSCFATRTAALSRDRPGCIRKIWNRLTSEPVWRCCWRLLPLPASLPSATSVRSNAVTNGSTKNFARSAPTSAGSDIRQIRSSNSPACPGCFYVNSDKKG